MVVLAGLSGLACHNWGGNGKLFMKGETVTLVTTWSWRKNGGSNLIIVVARLLKLACCCM